MRSKRWINRRAACASLVVVAALTIWAAVGGTVTHAAGSPAVTAAGSRPQSTLVEQLAEARIATAKYVTNLQLAKADGYGIITKMIPNMGYHFMNPNVKGFSVRKPILVYEHRGPSWLAALEWVYTAKPASPPLPGAKYGTFGVGCHYKDGTFVPADTQGCMPDGQPADRLDLQLLAFAPDH